ncbi:unnamed protein product [Rotaria magnacalcarata]|uniref:Uncharacterized protein n=1 Tax=Rotaria magnacalcarata TaxID=392030 RepID=A0A816YZC9_9BILA|nr:unnamed protein product [Rotaria magnacalcarata]
MDNQSEDSIMITSSIEAEQEIMAVTITTQTIKTPVSRKLKKKKGVFKKDGLNIKEYSSWLQEIKKDASQARCKFCLKTFSVHHEEKSAVNKHIFPIETSTFRSKRLIFFFCFFSEFTENGF